MRKGKRHSGVCAFDLTYPRFTHQGFASWWSDTLKPSTAPLTWPPTIVSTVLPSSSLSFLWECKLLHFLVSPWPLSCPPFLVPLQNSAVSVYFPGVLALTHLPDIIGISHLSMATNTPTLLHFLCFLFSTVLPSLYFEIFVSVGISTVLGGRHRSAILNPSRLFLGKLSAQFSCVGCFWCIVSCFPGVSSVRLKTCKSLQGCTHFILLLLESHIPKCEAFQMV